MTIAEKILRAKADYDAVYEAGKSSGGGGEVTETILEPTEVTENHCWNREFDELIEQENCDFYEYSITEMFGKVVKVKTILPKDCGVIFADDLENETPFHWYVENYDSDVEAEKEFAISGNDFSIRFSCVRTEGFPQVTVVSNGGGSVSLTPCFDGSISGEYVDENLTTLRLGAFAQCANIESVSLPNCTKIDGANAFTACSKLTTVNLQSLKTIADGSSTFNSATRLQKINLPELTTITTTTRMFQNCTSITEIRMPKLSNTSIAAYTFSNCNKLETLVLGGAVLNPLANTQAFTNTGNQAPNGLSIYVPDNLVDSYKSATNWSTLANKIKPISELEVQL